MYKVIVYQNNKIAIVPMCYGVTPDRIVIGTNMSWENAKALKNSSK
jgi:hypothetical protein